MYDELDDLIQDVDIDDELDDFYLDECVEV